MHAEAVTRSEALEGVLAGCRGRLEGLGEGCGQVLAHAGGCQGELSAAALTRAHRTTLSIIV